MSRITRREVLRRTVLFSTAALTDPTRFLRAAPPETKFSSNGLHLLALGDYGTRGDAAQTAVANAMAAFAQSLDQPLTAVLALGDNFYKKLTPHRFEPHFEKLYSPTALNCPFYACVGNHDYGTASYEYQPGKLQIELDYARNNPRSRWKLPAKWYTVDLPSAEKPLVKMIVLDGNYWEGALTPQEKIEQRHFLEAEFSKPSTAPWLWLVNHFPLFSDSKHGDTPELVREWGKYLQTHPVSLCLAGHDHNLQHLQVEGFAANFIVSGAGGAALYELKRTDRGFAANQQHGFNHIHVTPDELHVQFITDDGKCLHHFRRDQSGKVTVLV